jgi:hypothetical protein
MDLQAIESQAELERVLSRPDWSHAFIREAHLESPSYLLDEESVVAPEAPPVFRLLVGTLDPAHPAVEFVFEEVSSIDVSLRGGIAPVGTLDPGGVTFRPRPSRSGIRAQRMSWRVLSSSEVGFSLRYGKRNGFDPSGNPV